MELQVAANGADPDVIASPLGKELTKQLKAASRELLEATRHYEKAKELKAEASTPHRPNVGAVGLKIFNPESKKRKSA